MFAKFLYARGWDFESVLVVRAVLALPILWAWALVKVGRAGMFAGSRSAILGALGGGVLCYYIGALFNFYALTLIAASVERVLLFSYPSIVVLLHALLYRRFPSAGVLAALAITYVGILMVVTGLDFAVLKANLAGAGLVLVCSLTFAIYYLLSDRYTPRIGSVAFTVYALSAATACLVVHCVVLGRLRPLPLDGAIAGLMAGLVLVATVFGMLAMSEGVRRLGAQRAAVVSTVGPPTTILLGAALLGERLTGPQWVGVALIVAGIVVLEAGRQKAPAPAPD